LGGIGIYFPHFIKFGEFKMHKLEYFMFERFGGGIGVTRMVRAISEKN
tara:strand:+ start:10 stop:153 length:144 start_codon:yes stop_codon:yes gene_type:complete